jgi:hypothetical protein
MILLSVDKPYGGDVYSRLDTVFFKSNFIICFKVVCGTKCYSVDLKCVRDFFIRQLSCFVFIHFIFVTRIP